MKKLFFAAACAALLASCASLPSGDGTTTTAPQPIAPANMGEPENTPQTDDDGIIVAENTGDTQLSAPADEPKPNDGQTDDKIARAETIPGTIRWLTNESDGQNIGTAITEKTDDAQTDGTETADDYEPATHVADTDEIIAEADILPPEPTGYNAAVIAHQFLEPEIFDEPDPDIPVITVSDTDTLPTQQQTASAQTETTASGQPLSHSTDVLAPQANEVATLHNTAESAAQDVTTPAQNTPETANQPSEIAEPHNATQSATQSITNLAQNTPETPNHPNEIAEPHNATQSATQSITNPAQNTNATANRPSEPTVPRSTTHYTATADDAQPNVSATPQSQIITPSRTVTIKNNQYVDVVYPGSGWVYLGETEENRDTKKEPIVSYFGRKLGTTDTTFSLRSRKPGKTLLHFYKNDALTGQYIDDYLEVTIEAENAAAGVRATAPAYAQVVPPKPSRQARQAYDHPATNANKTETEQPANDTNHAAEQPPASTTTVAQQPKAERPMPVPDTPPTIVPPTADERGVKTVIQTTESAPSGEAKPPAPAPSYAGTTAAAANRTENTTDESGSDLLEQAKRAYADKQYENALDLVQRYLDDASEKIDEALFLQGQILEADSSVKSVRSAIDSYESLTKNHPMSALWKKANNRIIYLKRFYIEIR